MTEMDVTAPYSFVPLSDRVCTAADLGLAGLPAQDMPEPGSLSGTIPFTLKCDNTLLVGDGGSPRRFLRAPEEDGKPIIPGSSLRGMIRNVLEIASFARFKPFVDNQRVGVRDLEAQLDYQISETVDSAYSAKSRAGWLKLKDGKVTLTPCDYGRIDHCDLQELSKGFVGRAAALAARNDQNERGARQVEAAFLKKCPTTEHRLFVQRQPFAHQHSCNKPLLYKRVATTAEMADRNANAGTVQKPGRIVFTGLPGPNKHMEFFFFDRNPEPVEVPPEVWRKFLDVHERQEKVSRTWEWRRETFRQGGEIPVFWLAGKDGKPCQIGLAMMFKIAADNSVHDLIPAPHGQDAIDLPTRIFGRIHETDSFKTRVSFGFATLTGDFIEECHENVVAARPKPSFTPSYIRQKDFGNTAGTRLLDWTYQTQNGERTARADYRSYMDWQGRKEELRGWKRYPAQGSAMQGPGTGEGDATSTLCPIRATQGELAFTGHIRFHNLQPVELGALLWALTWGGRSNLRHGLGMGKPFGWGQVWFEPGEVEYARGAGHDDPMGAFTTAMESWMAGWENSLQIRQLLAMADPALGAARIDSHLRQMALNPQTNANAFLAAKKARTVLPEYDPPGQEQSFTIANKNSVKRWRPPRPNRARQSGPRTNQPPRPPGPTLSLSVGGTAYYEGMEVTIVSIDGNTAVIRYEDDGGTESGIPLSALKVQ